MLRKGYSVSRNFLWIENIQTVLGKFGPKKLSFLLENWHKCYLKDADSYSNISFLNFQPKIYFWANMGQKKSKLSVLPENWHTFIYLFYLFIKVYFAKALHIQ